MASVSLQKYLKIILISGGVLVLGSAVGVYFIWRSYEEEKTAVEATRDDITQAKRKQAKIKGLEKDVIKLRENLSESVKILPSSREVNEFVYKMTEFADIAGVKILDLKPKDDRTQKKGADVFQKIIYRVEMNGTFDEVLRFANALENYERFVKITSLDLAAEQSQSAQKYTAGLPRHKCSMEVETYVYHGNSFAQEIAAGLTELKNELKQPNLAADRKLEVDKQIREFEKRLASAKQVDIPNYDKKKTELTDEIVSARRELPVVRYTLTNNIMRRDPLVDPRQRLHQQGGKGLEFEKQGEFITWAKTSLDEIQKLTDLLGKTEMIIRRLEIERSLQQLVTALAEKVERAVNEGWITDPNLRKQLDKEIAPATDKLVAVYGDLARGQSVTLEELRNVKDAMEQDFEKGAYQHCIERFDLVQGRVHQQNLDADVRTVLEDIQRLVHHARTAIEFEARKIRISGRIVQDLNSVVVVNGKVLQEGEALDEDLYVYRIKDDRVEFRYRGVILQKML
ncbi:MAG: type 4a pilus biogenesis protein PilO [Planctomycetota bacterium]